MVTLVFVAFSRWFSVYGCLRFGRSTLSGTVFFFFFCYFASQCFLSGVDVFLLLDYDLTSPTLRFKYAPFPPFFSRGLSRIYCRFVTIMILFLSHLWCLLNFLFLLECLCLVISLSSWYCWLLFHVYIIDRLYVIDLRHALLLFTLSP